MPTELVMIWMSLRPSSACASACVVEPASMKQDIPGWISVAAARAMARFSGRCSSSRST